MVIKELEDYAWFPPVLRRFQVEIIGEIACRMKIYSCLAGDLRSLTNDRKVVTDLCSGSGLPAICLIRSLRDPDIQLTCTDLYPQPPKHHTTGTYQSDACNVLTLEPDPNIVYTMFNAFHHFTDLQKKQIIERMLHQKSRFLFAEILEPGLLSLISVIVASLAGTIIFTPFIKPFSWKRIVLTYLIPVNILTVLIDGIISVFRATNDQILRTLFANEIKEGRVVVKRSFYFPVFVTSIRSL